jgi:DNA-binding MarR family transcriptional regulator
MMQSDVMAKESDDHVERLRRQWARELPDVDTEGMAILGRARRISLAVGPTIEEILHRFGLDRGEFDVLASLRRTGVPFRLSPTELYRSLMISSGGLTDRLARLERRELISRLPSDGDARSILVELTPKGRRCVEYAFRADMEAEGRLLTALNGRERLTLAHLLNKLARAIEKEGQHS